VTTAESVVRIVVINQTLSGRLTGLEKVQWDIKEHKSQIKKVLQEVRENIAQCKVIMRQFLESEKSSKQTIQGLEESNERIMRYISKQEALSMEWMDEIRNRLADIEREGMETRRRVDELRIECFGADRNNEG